jgi:hypothetical protein
MIMDDTLLTVCLRLGTVNNPCFFGIFVVIFPLGSSYTESTLRSCAEKRLKNPQEIVFVNSAYMDMFLICLGKLQSGTKIAS